MFNVSIVRIKYARSTIGYSEVDNNSDEDTNKRRKRRRTRKRRKGR